MINVILQYFGLDLFNIKLSAKFYQNVRNGLRVNFHFFSEFEPRQNLDQFQMSFDNLMGYILSLNQYQIFITIYHSVQEILSISMRMQKFITILFTVLEIWPFSLFFRIWSSAKPRPMKNDILLSLGLDLDTINVYAEVYQNIPLSLRDKAIFTFSEFGRW